MMRRQYVARGECRSSDACYKNGCRNDPCRAAHRLAVKRKRLEQLRTGELPHGTRAGYDAGCRCTRCVCARSAAYHERERAA